MHPRQIVEFLVFHMDTYGPQRPITFRLRPEPKGLVTPVGGRRPFLARDPRSMSTKATLDSPLGEIRARTPTHDVVAFDPVELFNFAAQDPRARLHMEDLPQG